MVDLVPSLEHLHELSQLQQPVYEDLDEARQVVSQLRHFPPLVFVAESDNLRDRIACAARGEAFILMGGDCAETFAMVRADNIMAKLRVLLSMSVVMTYAAQVPVVKIGRIAGQYAKPRSKNFETRGEITLPAYRGDAVNGFEFTAQARRHDPQRLIRAYNASAATLNLVRAFVSGGFADLHHVHAWNSSFVKDDHVEKKYEQMAAEIDRALGFMDACGVDDVTMNTVKVFAAHEALLLDYEHALTRVDSRTGNPYATSGHMVWIGERNRSPQGAQVELLRHVHNPLGVKIGPSATTREILEVCERLDPDRQPGRLSLITRMGAGQVREKLPPIIEAVSKTGRLVAWICDPMHGNTVETANGYKTRRYDDVVAEINGFFDVHKQMGTWPGGVHLEQTGQDVTECVGGAFQLSEKDLVSRYQTACDPRLNRNQSLEIAFMIATRLNEFRHKKGPSTLLDWQL